MSLLLRALPALLWFALACLYGLVDALVRGRDDSSGHRFARLCSWGCLRILGLRPRIQGLEHLVAHQPCVYVANHQSYVDVLVYGACFPPRTLLVAKKQILWIPLFGLMYAAMGNLLIDRTRRDQAVGQMGKAARAVRERGVSVWVFPEGTRGRDGDMLPFKKGAFHLALEAGVPIVPLVMEPLRPRIDLRRLHLAGGDIALCVLPPVDTSAYSPETVDEFVGEVRRRMEAARADLSPSRDA